MHIGLLSLEFGIIDYDLNRKTIFTLILNYVWQSGLFWHFRLMKLESCYFFQIHTLFKFTFYPFNHSAFRRMADLMHFIRWIEPKLKRPSALSTVGTRGDGAHWPPPPYFGRFVNAIEIKGADYAHHISTFPPPSGFSDLPTALALQEPPFRFWMGLSTEDQLHFIVDSPFRDMECSIDLSGI